MGKKGIDRRTFFKRGAILAAGGLTLGGPFKNLIARGALPAGSAGVAANNGGYGPLGPVPDLADGVVRLHLPEGFRYRSFARVGSVMSDGNVTPVRHDGMSAFPSRDGRIRLVRNHEALDNGDPIGDVSKAYDRMATGGTTTVEITPKADEVASWVSLSGTLFNCAGGPTPWGSWISCEETVDGPDVGPDFRGVGGPPGDLETYPKPVSRPHGYIFEVSSRLGPGEYERGVPIRSAGRLPHEAAAVDPVTGYVYMTEDNFNFPAGFYRYIPPINPMRAGRLHDGGRLEMLAIVGQPNADLSKGQELGATFDVEWVQIGDPDPTFVGIPSNNEAIQAVGQQGRLQGAALFSRLEGAYYANRKIFFNSTQGGATPAGADAPRGFGDGFGQLWAYDLDDQTLTLVFESPGPDVLDMPDNITITPRGSILLCEDGSVDNLLRGLTADGQLFDFALNTVEGRESTEFAGATFNPKGTFDQVLYVNIQGRVGTSFAIWGPWGNGPL